MDKFKIILNTTSNCNYNCSYCNVIRDKKKLWIKQLEEIVVFVKKNHQFINWFKFFWWEPLLSFEHIKYIIDNTKDLIWNKFETVTNTSILNNNIWEYFSKYFERIFFSINNEYTFDYEKVFNFIKKFKLKDKTYFNLIITPGNEKEALKQFEKLYNNWIKNFNILPVYLTKAWESKDLLSLSKIMKKILDKSIIDKSINLFWFQQNEWYQSSLVRKGIFIDIDWKIYYSDIVTTHLWSYLKKDLYLWNINNFKIESLIWMDLLNFEKLIIEFEKNIYTKLIWQIELHKIMDYFSKYLNYKK